MNDSIGLQNTVTEAIVITKFATVELPKLLSTAIGRQKCLTAAVNTSAVDIYAQTLTIIHKCAVHF